MNNKHSKSPIYFSSDDDIDDETDLQLLTTDADDEKSNESDYSDSEDLESIEFEPLELELMADQQNTTLQGIDLQIAM